MIHTTIKLSEVTDENINHAAEIVAKSCLRGAEENQEQNGLENSKPAILENWSSVDEIISTYTDYMLENNATFYSNNPIGMEYHDELILDNDDADLFGKIKSLAIPKLQQLLES